jgi:hypothetical protein
MFNKVMHEWCSSCPGQQLLLLRTKICCEVARAGVLPALAQACQTAAAALQQQSNQVNSVKQLLDNNNLLMTLWRGVVLTWPQQGWCTGSEQLAGTVAPAASLAVSMLQDHSAAAENKSHATGAGRILALEISNTLGYNSVLLHEADGSSSASSSRNRDREVALVQSDHVLKLLLMLLACSVQQQHKSQRGRSAAAAVAADGGTGKLAVPDYHSGESNTITHMSRCRWVWAVMSTVAAKCMWYSRSTLLSEQLNSFALQLLCRGTSSSICLRMQFRPTPRLELTCRHSVNSKYPDLHGVRRTHHEIANQLQLA